MSTVDDLKARGNAAYSREDYNTAVGLYQKGLELDPTNHVLLSNRSAAYIGLEDYELALQDANACLNANPEFVKAYSRQAVAYAKLNQPGFAEAAYRKGLAKDSSNAALKQGLAQLLQEDGDQSKRSHKAGNDQPIRDHMSKVGEEFPTHLAREPNQFLIKSLQCASLNMLKTIWRPQFLLYRATPNYLPITSLIVAMAQRCSPQEEAMPGYIGILTWVLEQGARVDARDIGGYTALGHAAAHHPVLKLAQVLIDKGADVNARNRFGCTVLHSAIMASEESAAKVLIKWGADPDIYDNDGVSPKQIARLNPRILACIHSRQGTNKETEEQYSHKCGQCGKAGSARRCSKCRLITYCSPECQKAHWPTHKESCKEQSEQKLRVNITKAPPSAGPGCPPEWSGVKQADIAKWAAGKMNNTPAPMPSPKTVKANINVKDQKLFVVKIQVPKPPEPMMNNIPPSLLERMNISQEGFSEFFQAQQALSGRAEIAELMCYNQKRDFMCWIPRKQNDSEQLAKLIQEGGLSGGLKAYFKAYVDQATKQLVVVPKMLPAQPW